MIKIIMIFGKELIQKITASVIGRFIYDAIKGILKIAFIILIISIVLIYIIQYNEDLTIGVGNITVSGFELMVWNNNDGNLEPGFLYIAIGKM